MSYDPDYGTYKIGNDGYYSIGGSKFFDIDGEDAVKNKFKAYDELLELLIEDYKTKNNSVVNLCEVICTTSFLRENYVVERHDYLNKLIKKYNLKNGFNSNEFCDYVKIGRNSRYNNYKFEPNILFSITTTKKTHFLVFKTEKIETKHIYTIKISQ